jgi:hypothetical protein
MKTKIFFLVLIATFIILPVSGQDTKTKPKTPKKEHPTKSFGLFSVDTPLEISLRFDMSAYLKTKPKDYIKAVITIHLSKTDSINQDIRLKTRGEFRNRTCYFAPIELNFKKADFGYSDLNKISKLKLVSQCNIGNEYENYIFREYLTYKLFNVMTDTSFRVRLLIINYIDTEKKKKPVRQYGFFIEPLEMMAVRTNSAPINSLAINQKSIMPKEMDRVAIFNYMIGNYDWAVPKQHNVKVIKPLKIDTVQLAIAVPYDFDWTGLVNAAYAVPAEVTGTQSVRERIFLGVCRTKEVYQKDLDQFLEKKEAFNQVINDFPLINQRTKKDMTIYLDQFFKECTGKKEVLDIFTTNCKKI